MKKLLTILILLLAVVTQGWAVDAITTLYPLPHDVGSWNSLQIDYDLVSGIKSGDKITIYINKDDRNHNIQVQYEKPKELGDGNDWTGIGIDLATETEGEIYSITMTETAAGYFNETTKSKLILTGENYTVTKVTLTHDDTPKQLFPKTVINGWGNISISKDLFTNAVVNDIVKAEFNESVSSAELKFLYGWGSGEEYTITTDETSKIVSLTIASEEILNNILKKKGLLISPRSDNSVSIKDVKIVPTYQLSVTTENGKLYLGDTETEYINNTRYEAGSSVSLRAVANDGYRFVNWTNESSEVVSTDATFTTASITGALTLTANFIQQFTITATSANESLGTVSITNQDAYNKYDSGSTFTVTATPTGSNTFKEWTVGGTQVSTEAEYSFTVTEDRALVAEFNEASSPTYEGTELTPDDGSSVPTTFGGDWSSSIKFGSAKISAAKTGDILIIYLSSVGESPAIMLQEYYGTYHSLQGSSLTISDNKAQYVLDASAAAFLKDNGMCIKGANLTVDKVTLKDGGGSASVPELNVSGFYDIVYAVESEVHKRGKRNYLGGSSTTAASDNQELLVTFAEGASDAKVIVSYVDGTADAEATLESEATTVSVPLASGKAIKKVEIRSTADDGTIKFSLSNIAIQNIASVTQYTLTVTQPNGGKIQIGGVDAAASQDYDENTQVTLTPVANSNWQFSKWMSGATELDAESNNTLQLTMTKDTTVTAVFTVIDANILDYDHELVTNDAFGSMSSATTGNTIHVLISKGTGDQALEIYTKTSGWGYVLLSNTVPEGNYVDIAVTDENKANISERGLYIKGSNITVTNVGILYSFSVTEPANGTVAITVNDETTPTEETSFIAGTKLTAKATATTTDYEFASWTKTEDAEWSSTDNPLVINSLDGNYTLTATFTNPKILDYTHDYFIAASNFSDIAEGGGITFTCTVLENQTGQLKIIYPDSEGNKVYTNDPVTLANDGTYMYSITDETICNSIKTYGLWIQGAYATFVSVTFTASAAPIFDENGKADLSKFVSDGTAGYSYADGKGTITTGEDQTYKGVILNLGENDYVQGTKLIFKFQSETSAQIHVCYVGAEWADGAQVSTTGTEIIVPLDATKKVNRIDIQLWNANTTAVLTEVSISNKCTLTTSATNGSIAIKKGNETVSAGSFELDTELTLTATANKGYVFNKWTKDGTAIEDTSNPLTITMTADVTMAAIFKGTPLDNEERRTLWENAGGQALDWNLMFDQTSAVGEIVETGEILIFTVKEVGANPKIWLMSNDGNTTLATLDPLIVGENRLSITADMKTAMEEGFKFKGGDATITKIELYKPTPITALAEEETKTLWSNTSGTALTWNTIAIDRAAEWGAVLEEDERIIISVKAKETGEDVWPTVQLQNDTEKIASTANLLNDLTVPCDITITLTAEMVNKMKNGFSITGDKATITKAELYKPTMPAKTVHTLNTTETAISGDANVTVAAAKFANISAYDVLTVNFTITTSPANVILKGNGEDGGWDYLKEMKFENGETLFALPLTPAMTSNLKKNGLQITGSDYKCKSVTIKTAGEVPSDGEDDISNDASEEAKKVYNVLKDLYGKKIVSGVVANVDWNTKEAENVYGWTGKYPAMNVYDYINLHASKDVNSAGWVDYSDITTAKNWWKEGGIVGAMWHWQVKANNGTDYTCTPGTAAGETSFDASKVYVEGTSENTLAKQQLDQLCGYLKKMQDAGIPVVWRPLHEASGNVEQYSGGKAWFWWGAKGADVYKQLWQWMYNYMVKTKGLNNLIWVWTSQTKDNNWYPGDAYVDIIGRDNYGATAATLATEYETQKAAYPNKMITLSECGNSESTGMAKLSSIWDAGSRWSWFMTWYDGDYNKGASTTHKHAGETWWKDAVSKDYVITRDKMKELLGQESSDDSKTGVNISLDDLNEGWSSSYNATTKTITTEGEWAARGWYIGDNRYNSKGSVTVKFEAVNFGVTLKMEYTNTGGESKSVSAGAAAGETGVELDIPADIKTMDKVYITYQPIGTLKLTAATVNDKVVDNRTERTLVEKSQAISDGDIAINRGLFSNAVAGDEIRIYADGLSESSKLALEPGDYSGAFDGANWTGFTESPFKLKLTATLIATIKEKGLLIRGESFTFKKAVLYTEKELGSEISDEEKKGDEEKDDDETIIDKKTGEADLTVLSAQDDTKTTLTENEDGSITMTTTEPYCAAQIWFNDPEPVAGNVLKVELAESKVNVTITVQYTDGTQSQMSANTSGVATARAATRGDSDPGTTIEVPLETGKEVQNIEVKNNVAGTITIKKMQVTTINIFTNGVANLSMLKPQSNATYDTSTHTLATTKGWTGATISPVGGENVSGKELLIEFADASKVKVAVKYRTDVEGPSTIMEKAAKAVRLALDNTKNIQEISIQPTEASIVTFKKIAVNSEESDDGTLKPGKTITLWENAAGETLSWNEVAKQDASVGEILQEYDELLITISGVTEGCDWPKVFIRDASSEQAGNEVLLNDVGSFPYTVRIVLTGEMAQQLQKGFSICGDGVTVTKLQVYRPEAPKTGDIHLADLNYGYNSSYDKGTHTITTTARWAARGWEIGDKRYNDKNLITVKFEPVDFPVTLKMEYTTGLQTAQATSVGVPAGRTELLLEIPSGISKLDRVYIIYENPGSVKLTEASVTYQDKLKLSTAIEAFEAEGVIHDGRYDTDGWYNLRGMRIAEPKTSGIYIHGGKKVVIY